jgi:hypothetical protein
MLITTTSRFQIANETRPGTVSTHPGSSAVRNAGTMLAGPFAVNAQYAARSSRVR